MKKIIVLAIFAVSLSACSSFDGVATKPGETYTTRYNLPTEKISPYNNPTLDDKVDKEDVEICKGNPDKKGFKCDK